MKQRILTAGIGLLILIPCLIFSYTIVFDIFIALCAGIAVFELLRCTHHSGNLLILIPTVLFALFSEFAVRAIGMHISYAAYVLIAFVLYFLFIFTVAIFSHGKLPVQDAGLIVAMVMYIVVGFGGVLYVRGLTNSSLENIGGYLFLLIFISSWVPDAGAYFVGVNFGKHKLIPDVSPKKSVEGALGGIAASIVSFMIYTIIVNLAFDAKLHFGLMLLASIVLAVASMIGDLIASLIKRHFSIKDYGKLLPGHGGVLDRFDSMLSTSCVMLVLFMIPAFADNILR